MKNYVVLDFSFFLSTLALISSGLSLASLFFLTFFNQWLRSKVSFCNYQSQPFLGIAPDPNPVASNWNLSISLTDGGVGTQLFNSNTLFEVTANGKSKRKYFLL